MSDKIVIDFEEGESQKLPIRCTHSCVWKNSVDITVVDDVDLFVKEYTKDGQVLSYSRQTHQIKTDDGPNSMQELSDVTSVIVDKIILSGTYWNPKDKISVDGVEISKFGDLTRLARRLVDGMDFVNTRWLEDNPIHIRYELGERREIEINSRFDLNFLLNYSPSSGVLLKDLEYGIYNRKYDEALEYKRIMEREMQLRAELGRLGDVIHNGLIGEQESRGDLYLKYEDKARKYEEKLSEPTIIADMNF